MSKIYNLSEDTYHGIVPLVVEPRFSQQVDQPVFAKPFPHSRGVLRAVGAIDLER